MMNKSFDCVKMKNDIQEKIWIEAGESVEGLTRYLDEQIKNSSFVQEFKERLANEEKFKELKII